MFFAAVRKSAFINSNMNTTLVSQRRAGAFAWFVFCEARDVVGGGRG
jgi:hypothetical protein